MKHFLERLRGAIEGWRTAGRSAHQENLSMRLEGRWKDVYTYEDGRVVEGLWTPNQIQNAAPILVAGLLRRAGVTAFPGFDGITYIAVGSGQVSWDVTPPTQDAADTTLDTETFRKAIPEGDMFFLDPTLGPGGAPIAGPSRRIGITATLLSTEANGSLREFGLFGGLASGTVDTGTILNWVVHPLINKDTTLTITRTIEITCLEP